MTNWIELRPEQVYYLMGRATPARRRVPYSLLRDTLAYRFEILESDPAATALAKFRRGMAGVLEPEKADLVGQLLGFDFSEASSHVAALLGERFARHSSRAATSATMSAAWSRTGLQWFCWRTCTGRTTARWICCKW